jgi:hypothetical protein
MEAVGRPHIRRTRSSRNGREPREFDGCGARHCRPMVSHPSGGHHSSHSRACASSPAGRRRAHHSPPLPAADERAGQSARGVSPRTRWSAALAAGRRAGSWPGVVDLKGMSAAPLCEGSCLLQTIPIPIRNLRRERATIALPAAWHRSFPTTRGSARGGHLHSDRFTPPIILAYVFAPHIQSHNLHLDPDRRVRKSAAYCRPQYPAVCG